jgi:hypothetical protein
MSLEAAAAAAEGVSPWFWLLPVGLVIVGLVAWNWAKVKAAFSAALPEPPAFVPVDPVDASLDQIGALKNGFALLLELDRYSPKSMPAEERDALLLDGVERLLKARSEAGK